VTHFGACPSTISSCFALALGHRLSHTPGHGEHCGDTTQWHVVHWNVTFSLWEQCLTARCLAELLCGDREHRIFVGCLKFLLLLLTSETTLRPSFLCFEGNVRTRHSSEFSMLLYHCQGQATYYGLGTPQALYERPHRCWNSGYGVYLTAAFKKASSLAGKHPT
jgi:hypothetical protein